VDQRRLRTKKPTAAGRPTPQRRRGRTAVSSRSFGCVSAVVNCPLHRAAKGDVMPEAMDPTFYRSPSAAVAAPPEALAYVAAFDPAGAERDAMTVVDCDAASPTYGEVVGWTELPSAGNELHHFGWNACSSALCHEGHAHHEL